MIYCTYKVVKSGCRNMKKLLKFSAYPLVTVLVVAVNALLFYFSTVGAVSFMQTISLVFYIFLGGLILNKINDKKIRNCSLIFTLLILLVGGICCALQMSVGSDTASWIGMIVFPFSLAVSGIFPEYYLSTIYLIAFVVGAVLPVLISYIASIVFGIEKKKFKAVLIAVMALVCIGSAVNSTITILKIFDNSIYENGEFYTAYYDINGIKYESNEEVPYYDRDGNVYHYTYNHPVEEYSDEWYSYVGEITDENGKEYDVNDFYVYADGYIFMDLDNSVELRDDLLADVVTDWLYVDVEGNICAPILGVSYTSDGEPYCGMGDEYKER